MGDKPESRVKIAQELFWRLKVISSRMGKDVPELIEGWVEEEERKQFVGATNDQ